MHYLHPYRHYAQIFGIPERSIKRWVAIGKQSTPTDIPPFDKPEDFPAWWSRHSNQRPPARMLQFLAGKQPEVAADDGNDATITEEDTANPLVQAEKHRAVANKRLNEALAGKDEGRINQWHRIWLDTLEAVLKAERAQAEQQRIRGKWIDRDELSASIAILLDYLTHMRSALPRRVAANIAGRFTTDQLNNIQEAITAEQRLQDSLFARIKAISQTDLAAAWLELSA